MRAILFLPQSRGAQLANGSGTPEPRDFKDTRQGSSKRETFAGFWVLRALSPLKCLKTPFPRLR